MDHLPSNTLGCFTSIHMLGHLNDETAVSVLMTWRRVLGPGGRVLAVMPDPASTEQDLVKETVGLDGLEVRLIGFLQAVIGRGPVVNFANLLSTFGEHAAGWLLVGVGGAIVDAPRRQTWVGMGTAAFTAHAAAVVIKRVVRRPRPDSPLIRVLDSTPSRLSFPSAHAASTTAAATMLAPLVGVPLAVPVPVAMGVGRVLLGVHYPSDVLAGAGVGLLVGVLARRYWIRP
jgi:membrane-associated phospholipid phosphatase